MVSFNLSPYHKLGFQSLIYDMLVKKLRELRDISIVDLFKDFSNKSNLNVIVESDELKLKLKPDFLIYAKRFLKIIKIRLSYEPNCISELKNNNIEPRVILYKLEEIGKIGGTDFNTGDLREYFK